MLASRKHLALGVLASVLLIACSVREGGKSQADGIAGLVDIGGREIYLECRGEGRPLFCNPASATTPWFGARIPQRPERPW
jgi:hypothetical protein